MRKAWFATAFALALVLGLSAPDQQATAVSTTTITIGDNYFCSPSYEGSTCPVTVTAGDTVVWSFTTGSSVHTITASLLWDSGVLHVGGTFSRTFGTPGTFSYRCDIHPNDMRGSITVLDASQPPAQSSPSAQSDGSPASGSGSTPPPALSPGSVPARAGGTPSELPATGGEPPVDLGPALWWLGVLAGAGLIAAGALSLASSRRSVRR